MTKYVEHPLLKKRITMEEAVTIMADRLLDKTGRCVDENDDEACRYRDNKGNACVVGAIIPNEKYAAALEGNSAFSPDVVGATALNKDLVLNNTHLGPALRRFQQLHDEKTLWDSYGYFTRIGAYAFIGVCTSLGLEAPEKMLKLATAGMQT